MSRIGQTCLVVSHPRPADYVARAGIITADHDDGTVDVSVFNPHSAGPASVREASMPVMQTMGPIPLAKVNGPKPEDYRGRWIAVLPDSAVSADYSAALEARAGAAKAVVKPNPAANVKRQM